MTRPLLGESINSDQERPGKIFYPGLSELALKGEIVQQIEVPEIDNELRTVYVRRPSGLIIVGCSDERIIVPESAAKIKNETGLGADGPILRIYGAATGAARIALVSIAAEHPDHLGNFHQNGYEDFVTDFISRAHEKAGVLFAVHSASANELHKPSLNLDSHLDLGCAHAINTGKISDSAAHNPVTIQVAGGEAISVFGPERAKQIPRIAKANATFLENVLDGDTGYGADRQTFARIGTPVMILGGDHLPADQTEVVENFSIDEIANPKTAKNLNRLHYTYDMTQMAEVIMKSFPELKLRPETILLAMHQDIVATRGALAGGQPTKLKLTRYGNVEQAISYLESIYRL